MKKTLNAALLALTAVVGLQLAASPAAQADPLSPPGHLDFAPPTLIQPPAGPVGTITPEPDYHALSVHGSW